jgi:hypothetical protein
MISTFIPSVGAIAFFALMIAQVVVVIFANEIRAVCEPAGK